MRILRIILALIFLFSGFVKGIDPMGLSYKIEEYLLSFGFVFLKDYSINIAVFLCAFELCLGLLLICNIYKKLIAIITTFASFLFLLITFYIYMDTYVSINNCGCFGEAVTMSNDVTFYKNIFLFIAAFIYMVCTIREEFKNEKLVVDIDVKKGKDLMSTNVFHSFICLILIFLLSYSIPAYSINYLPPFDFMEYDRGEDLLVNEKFENKIFDEYDNDISKKIITKNKEIIFFVSQDINYLSSQDIVYIKNINNILKKAKIKSYILTSSNILENKIFKKKCLSADEIFLKSLLRSKKGVVLIKNGIIRAKWEMNNFPFSSLTIDENSALIYKGYFIDSNLLNSQDCLVLKYLITLGVVLMILYLIRNRGHLYYKK